MMKQWKIHVLTILIIIFVLPLTAKAEERKDEWKQAGYEFAPMKMVYVETEFGDEVEADALKKLILTDKVNTAILANVDLQRAGFLFLNKDQLSKKISEKSGKDLPALPDSNPVQYEQLIKEGASYYCQGILKVRFNSYYDTVRYSPEYIETYETTKRIYLNKLVRATNGTKVRIDEWIDVPVTEARVVPARDETTSHIGVELALIDTSNNQLVWQLIDNRDAVEKEKDGIIDRTLKRAAEHLESVKK